MPTPLFNVRLPQPMQDELRAAAKRRNLSTSDYVRPFLQWLATADDQDPIWQGLGFMRLPDPGRRVKVR